MKKTILVIEDHKSIADLIRMTLQMKGYEVLLAGDGKEGLECLHNFHVDLLILDLMLPDTHGYEILRKIDTKELPVIILTAMDSVHDKVTGLNLGCDDFMTKPFDSLELIARIESVMRRYDNGKRQLLVHDVYLDLDRMQVKKENEIIDVTQREFELLHYFVKHANKPLSRQEILDDVWGKEYDGGPRTLDIHVQRLRSKLEFHDYIETVYKVGYRFYLGD